jgi:hypothetical protein
MINFKHIALALTTGLVRSVSTLSVAAQLILEEVLLPATPQRLRSSLESLPQITAR